MASIGTKSAPAVVYTRTFIDVKALLNCLRKPSVLHVAFGSDTYGRVRNVRGTPIVTKFGMLNVFPVWPLESYYWLGEGETKTEGVPFIATIQSVEIVGLPLARLDRLSVSIAYLRGVCATMIVFGAMALVPGLMYLTGERLDRVAMQMTYVMLAMLGAGITIGTLSYLWPFQVSPRDRQIRAACGLGLGICIDPAKLTPEAAMWVAEQAKKSQPMNATMRPASSTPLKLLEVRSRIALAESREPLEKETDELLAQLESTI